MMTQNKEAEAIARAKIVNRFAATEKALSFRQTLKRLFKSLKNQQLIFYALVVVATVATILSGFIPYLIGKFVGYLSDIVALSNNYSNIDYTWLKLLTLIYLGSVISLYIEKLLLASFSQKALAHFRELLFAKIKKLPLSYFEEQAHGDTLSRFSNDIEAMSIMISESFTFLVTLSLKIIISSTMMFLLSPKLALAIFALVPIIYTVSHCISKKAKPLYKKQANILGKRFALIEESFSALDVIRDYNQIETMSAKYQKVNEEYKEVAVKAQITVGYLMPLLNVITNMSLALIALLGGYLAFKFGIGIGVIVSFIAYSRQFIRPVNQIASTYSSLQAALASAERVFEFLDLPEEEERGRLDFNTVEDLTIRVNNLSFAYDNGKQVLKDINLIIPPHKKIALVGETGAGKTTLAALISRFYPYSQGEIEIGEHPLKAFSLSSFYDNFAIVLQDSYLFKGTIADNIRYAKLDASDEEVIAAAKMASCDSFINKLPLAYQTVLTNGGTNISQGERQLLTIARAILADPKILILDEATSSVDTQTESVIQKAMLNLMQNRTSIIIAHRLSTIKDADCIYLMEDGKIIEEGNHSELMGLKGKYYQLQKA